MLPSRVRIPPSPLTVGCADEFASRGETRFPPCAPFLRASGSPSVAAPRGSAVSRGGTGSGRATMPRRTRRGGRAVECGGLENRYPSLGGSRVQIPPPPLESADGLVEVASPAYRGTV